MHRDVLVPEAADQGDDTGDHSHGDDDRSGRGGQGGEADSGSTRSDRTGGNPAQHGASASGDRGAANADFAGAGEDAGEFFAR